MIMANVYLPPEALVAVFAGLPLWSSSVTVAPGVSAQPTDHA